MLGLFLGRTFGGGWTIVVRLWYGGDGVIE